MKIVELIINLAVIITTCTLIYFFCVWLYGKKRKTAEPTAMPFNKYDDDFVQLQEQISNATTNFQLIQITKKIIKFQKDYDIKNDAFVQMDVNRLINHLEFKEETINIHSLEYTL